jgi:2-polyprenyl-3-methyl-5-hydroxy-6-metoxy-1,4-benzoquinol methylase
MLGIHDTDREWRKWGSHDLFYAVLSDSKFRDKSNIEEFFQSGEAHFDELKKKFEQLGIVLSNHGQALDYGCGVGRVLRPMANYFDHVIGVDAASAMLQEAGRYLEGRQVNLRHFKGNDIDECLGQNLFEFIHSTLVFQHIRPRRGLHILDKLLQCMDLGGKAYIQLPIYAEKKLIYIINQIVTCHPLLLKLSRIILQKRKLKNDPVMQMNVYPPVQLIKLFHRRKVEVRCLSVIEDHKNALIHAGWYLVRS